MGPLGHLRDPRSQWILKNFNEMTSGPETLDGTPCGSMEMRAKMLSDGRLRAVVRVVVDYRDVYT